MTRYTLYGAPISFFTGKVRAYLDWKGIPYEEVLSTAEIYRNVVVPRVGFPVIPIVVTDAGETLQDSTDIIDTLELRHGAPSITPPGGLQRLFAALMELYGDEWLVIPAMHYRWHHNRDWAMRAFGELSLPDASPDEQWAIGVRRAGPFSQAAVLLGAATPQMQAAVERSYEALLAELNAHFQVMPYTLGTRPSMADIGLYGPLYAHQYRDPASGELMRRIAPNVVRWIQRLETQDAPRGGDFLDGDEVPATLDPIVRRQMREQMSVLADSAQRLCEWLADHPQTEVPRMIGQHAFELEGVRGERVIRPYSLWMLQRARDAYRALEGTDRERADAWLDRVGGGSFRDFQDPPRLVRRGLTVAPAG
ncbi:glutathione S-transferase [Hydrogenophaga sp.]|uniref:glutathione S-transferase n=1 Tax=Hydrogenophaga sp. TaxID=1904254 RepID=UPI003D13A5C2